MLLLFCLLTLAGHQGPVSSCAWDRDGQRILSGSEDGQFKLWDANTGQCLWTGYHLPQHTTAALRNADGAIAASPGAWRYLGWRWQEQDRLLPAEHLGPLQERFPELPSG